MSISTQDGLVYAVEFSHRSGRDLINVAKKRTNIVPIIEDARHPHKYRMLMGKWLKPSWDPRTLGCIWKLSDGQLQSVRNGCD